MAKLLTSAALATLLFLIVASAQTEPPSPQTPPQRKPASFLPSQAVMNRLLQSWVYEVAAQYSLDEQQRDKVTAEVIQQWGRFFEENRDSIEPLLTDYLQMRLHPESLDNSHMRDWAHRAALLLAKLSDRMEHGLATVRKILKPQQRDRFEKQVQAFRRGLDDVESRLARLEKEEFSAENALDLLKPSGPRVPGGDGQRKMVARPAEPTVPWDRIELEIDAWRVYVKAFARTHRLDAGQRDVAMSMLSEMCQRAGAQRAGRRKEIEELERHIKSFDGSEKDFTELKQQLVKLYGPFDAMFRELKRRLDAILTAEQRARQVETKPANGEENNASQQRPPPNSVLDD